MTNEQMNIIVETLLEEVETVNYLGNNTFEMIENEEVTIAKAEMFTTDEGEEGVTIVGNRNGHSFEITTFRF